MVKKSRSKASFSFLSIPFLSGFLVVVIIVAALYINMNVSSKSVKSATDLRLPTYTQSSSGSNSTH